MSVHTQNSHTLTTKKKRIDFPHKSFKIISHSILFLVNFSSSNAISASNNSKNSSSHPNSKNAFTDKRIKTEIKKELTDEESTSISSNQIASSTPQQPSIEDEIARLASLLPPIDYNAANSKNTLDHPCTCTFREVITYSDDLEPSNETEKMEDVLKSENDFVKMSNGDMSDDDEETDDFCAVEDIAVEKTPPRSAVKSIFDPEYDANENLIEEMVRNRVKARNHENSKVIEVKIEKDAVKTSVMNNMIVPDAVPTTQPQIERVPIINYVCDEDPMCPARKHFEQKQVTLSDVQRLHNAWLPGVNGYFNEIVEEIPDHDFSKDADGIDYSERKLWKRVVPRYDFLTLDKVPKTFNNLVDRSSPPEPSKIKKEPDDDTSTSDNFAKNSQFEYAGNRGVEFREWHEVMNVRSYKDEILTILPYVVID